MLFSTCLSTDFRESEFLNDELRSKRENTRNVQALREKKKKKKKKKKKNAKVLSLPLPAILTLHPVPILIS